MGAVVALGDETLISGWGLAGVRLAPAGDDDAVRRAWAGLGADVGLVVLTLAATEALGTSVVAGGAPMTVVLPS